MGQGHWGKWSRADKKGLCLIGEKKGVIGGRKDKKGKASGGGGQVISCKFSLGKSARSVHRGN